MLIALIIGALGIFPIMRDVWGWTLGSLAVWTGAQLNIASRRAYTLFNMTALDKQIKALQDENLSVRAENIRLQEVISKSKLTEKEKKSALESGYGKVSLQASIISKSPANFLQNFLLDKGSKDGVGPGDAVIANGYLVGRITQVTDRTCRTDVITGGQLSLPVVLQESRSTGMIRGGLEGLVISDIPQDASPKEKEAVLTQNIENVIVPNIVIGFVKRVENHKGDIFQKAYVESPLNLSQLRIVSIVYQVK